MMMCTRWESLFRGVRDDALREHVVFQRLAANLVLPVAQPGILQQAHGVLGGIVIDRIGASLGDLAGLLDALLELGRLAVRHRLGEELPIEVDFRIIGAQLPLIHGDFYVPTEHPETVVKVEAAGLAGGLALVGGNGHVTLRNAHLAKDHVVVAQIEFRGLRIERNGPRRFGRRRGRHPLQRRQREDQRSEQTGES